MNPDKIQKSLYKTLDLMERISCDYNIFSAGGTEHFAQDEDGGQIVERDLAFDDSAFKYNSIYCGPWDNTRQYSKDDVVSFRDDLYVAALSHVNRIPSTFSGGTWQYVSKAHIISLLDSLTVENRDTKIIDTQQEFQRAIKL